MKGDSKIPIQNIYYLLCYAWNRLEERDIVDVAGIESNNLVDLFAKVLGCGIEHLLRRGLDGGYLECSEETRCLRGKLLFGTTIKRNLKIKAQVQCEFDEFNFNVIHNQILKTTLHNLIRVENIDLRLKDRLIGLYCRLNEVDEIALSKNLFYRIQLHRNNSFYLFLLRTCELIFENLMPSEAPGKCRFRDFFQDDDIRMASLFESFVRNFYKIEMVGFNISRENIRWQAKAPDAEALGFLPKMITDISIAGNGYKVVIDTKFYKKALVSHFGTEKIHSQHIYQIFAYLKNLEKEGGINANCSGVLLYPTTEKDLNLIYKIDNHKLIIRTLNLNQDWRNIDSDLKKLLEQSQPD